VDINLTWAIVAFVLGSIVTLWNAARQRAAEVHATRVEAFEAMQRDTWVVLQDALQALAEALEKLVDAYWRACVELEHERPDAPDQESVPLVRSEIQSEYDRAHLRSTALRSRLADDVSRRVVQHALHEVQGARWSYVTGRPLHELASTNEHRAAKRALQQAIERLGDLISQPPGTSVVAAAVVEVATATGSYAGSSAARATRPRAASATRSPGSPSSRPASRQRTAASAVIRSTNGLWLATSARSRAALCASSHRAARSSARSVSTVVGASHIAVASQDGTHGASGDRTETAGLFEVGRLVHGPIGGGHLERGHGGDHVGTPKRRLCDPWRIVAEQQIVGRLAAGVVEG